MGKFENTLKDIILKTIETYGEHFETHNLKTIETYGENWKHFERHYFEDHLKHYGDLKTFETYREIWKHFERHNLKTIETYGEIWKHFERQWKFENSLKHYGEFWKPLKPMGEFENHFETLWRILKHIIWKPLKPMEKFENTLKHMIWKPLKPIGKFENFERLLKTTWIWNTIETYETYGEIWKHFQTDNLKTIETRKFEKTFKHIILKTLWNLWGN